MRLKILDCKSEDDAKCYLCRVSLSDYIRSIPTDYKEFDVQRGIVSNRYLDNLVETVREKRHIPPIVLVSGGETVNEESIELKGYRILDGLQRTHRLKVIHDAIDVVISNKNEGLSEENINSYYRRFSSEFKKVGATRKLVKMLFDFQVSKLDSAIEFFEGNSLWLEVWCGLSSDNQIKKMLLLNAGHKSVNIKHQLELLFLGTLFKLEEISNDHIEFKREREVSATQYSKSRGLGQYHFSHIISALISLSAGKVVNTNSDFISGLQSGNLPEVELIEGFNIEFLRKFIEFVYKLDASLNENYGVDGLRWLGREVVLVGVFGAIGASSKERGVGLYEFFDGLISSVDQMVRELSVDEFEHHRNRVELNKVNVGSINKKAVYKAVYDIVSGRGFASWEEYFGGALK
ncbi:hypothetical protein MARLIPOL_03965 [Marinobacter lipolyticus SM19]|uniref:DUF262 domain-containing protein n=1 Tax=Marinobacter lipolyticus SM19 TaxID=1318628 RepID=R8B3R9_9GAMM|nr:hypothetical protein [Marinobacter lipolyticus]EON93159.1 hypothetical protein MARLIPOL_03965 [Marinobacter lipolyticus SM19]